MSADDVTTPPPERWKDAGRIEAELEVQRRICRAQGLVAVSAYAMDIANNELFRTVEKPVDDEVVHIAVEVLLLEAAADLEIANQVIVNGGLE